MNITITITITVTITILLLLLLLLLLHRLDDKSPVDDKPTCKNGEANYCQ